MAPARILPLNVKVLSTVHQNFKHPIDNLFDVPNGDDPDVLRGYNETTRLIQDFLQQALTQHPGCPVERLFSIPVFHFTLSSVKCLANQLPAGMPTETNSPCCWLDPQRAACQIKQPPYKYGRVLR